MKKLLIIMISVGLMSCGSTKKQEAQVDFNDYKSYFLKNGAAPENEPFYLATSNYAEFEKYFGAAATMSKQVWIDKNDLANKLIIAIADKTTNNTQSVKIKSMKSKDKTLYVDYIVSELDAPATFTARYVTTAVAAVGNIEKVVFSTNGKEVKQMGVVK